MEKRTVFLKAMAFISYLIMILVNILSFIYPLNGFITTQEIAISYPNLITPSGYSFSIWIFLYILLALFVVYQLDLKQIKQKKISPEMFNRIRMFFIITCFLNVGWIIAWNFDYIAFSLLIIVTILFLLVKYNTFIGLETLAPMEKLLVRLPFSIYYGWIVFMAISNAITLLITINCEGMGVTKRTWTVVILAITIIISAYRTWKNKDVAYCLTVIWALIGILVKHISKSGFDGQYPEIIGVVIGCMVILAGEIILLINYSRKRR